MSDDATRQPPPPANPARQARLAAELRANLQRRKALSRVRSAGAAEADGVDRCAADHADAELQAADAPVK
jgi:hypothetical protein